MIDIIIPAYNDPVGLDRTLASVVFPDVDWITVTVIDDCSTENYQYIQDKFSNVTFLKTHWNCGPGEARNMARRLTKEPYILFVDCGDIIYSKWCLYEIKDVILNNPDYYIYQWGWIDDETNLLRYDTHHSTPGKIYSRDFLESHGIWQCNGKGSYAGEDLSMNMACVNILRELSEKTGKEYIKVNQLPIYSTVTNPNSLTHKNNKEFMYKQTPGYIENIIHCLLLCRTNNVSTQTQLEILNNLTAGLYHQFLVGLSYSPELEKEYWPLMH